MPARSCTELGAAMIALRVAELRVLGAMTAVVWGRSRAAPIERYSCSGCSARSSCSWSRCGPMGIMSWRLFRGTGLACRGSRAGAGIVSRRHCASRPIVASLLPGFDAPPCSTVLHCTPLYSTELHCVMTATRRTFTTARWWRTTFHRFIKDGAAERANARQLQGSPRIGPVTTIPQSIPPSPDLSPGATSAVPAPLKACRPVPVSGCADCRPWSSRSHLVTLVTSNFSRQGRLAEWLN